MNSVHDIITKTKNDVMSVVQMLSHDIVDLAAFYVNKFPPMTGA